MTMNTNYELPDFDNEYFDNQGASDDIENNIAEFELSVHSTEEKSSKHNNKRNFLAKKKLEQLQKDSRRSKFDDDNYDDWD
ncbi:hypothetical protein [Colwellia echini]|uniref:Uncharacterized protein n=1 Tax=Colwellia echini TaxID=1982103 RepID=A0ABY3MVR9_9GAMM|nr:hypothetical protein [Colwellia echini]TYK65284.1 hypothetical protein CWS31_011530 [Colwellia echini]